MTHGHCVDGLPEQSILSDKVMLENASLLGNLATETVIPLLTQQYIKMTMVQREKKPHLIQAHKKIIINIIKMQTQFILPVLP